MVLNDIMKSCFTSFLLVLPLFIFSQTISCEELLDKTPSFTENHTISEESVQDDLKILVECGNFKPEDAEFINAPVLGSIMIGMISEEKELNYRNLITELKVFLPLLKSGEIFFEEELEPENSIDKTPTLFELTDIETAIRLGKENNKRVIIFFGGYGDSKTQRIKENILTDSRVYDLLSNEFMVFIGYVDDRTPSKNSDLTVGREILNLQIEKFKSNAQPFLYIIDDKGKIISQILSPRSVEDFLDFLNKGMK